LAQNVSLFQFLLSTMTFPELSPSLFDDARQGSSLQNESRITPVSAVEARPPMKILQLVNGGAYIYSTLHLPHRLYNQSLELDMDLVYKEANEDGDGDSNCSAAKVDKLFPSVLESTLVINAAQQF
jgi:hypothetical protein